MIFFPLDTSRPKPTLTRTYTEQSGSRGAFCFSAASSPRLFITILRDTPILCWTLNRPAPGFHVLLSDHPLDPLTTPTFYYQAMDVFPGLLLRTVPKTSLDWENKHLCALFKARRSERFRHVLIFSASLHSLPHNVFLTTILPVSFIWPWIWGVTDGFGLFFFYPRPTSLPQAARLWCPDIMRFGFGLIGFLFPLCLPSGIVWSFLDAFCEPGFYFHVSFWSILRIFEPEYRHNFSRYRASKHWNRQHFNMHSFLD